MNTIKLNTIGEVIVKGEGSSGGGKSGIKYYDHVEQLSPVVQLASIGKFFNGDTLELELIGPMVFPPAQQYIPFAFGVDLSQKMYYEGQMTTIAQLIEGRPLGAEITEEEFYHIPKEEIWDCSTQEGLKDAFEKLWALVERYGEEFINSETLPLIFWYNPLKFVGDSTFDDVDSSAIVGVRRGDTAVEDYTYIVFNPYSEYALKKYTSKEDGSVRYELGFFE